MAIKSATTTMLRDVRVVLLTADWHSRRPDFVLDGTVEPRSNPSHAKSWLVRLNAAKRKPPSKPVLAFHPNGHRRRLFGSTGVLGLHRRGSSFLPLLGRFGARDCCRVCPAVLLLRWRWRPRT